IRTGANSNRGVIFDGAGLRAYNTAGTKTFDIDTNGNAIFSGRLEAASGTFSGRLSAASGSFSGDITGSNGTFSGTLSAVGGSFSGELRGANGTFSGTLSGSTITGGVINGTTITGGSITSNTTINVTEGVQVGNYINIGERNSTATKYLYFNNGGYISGYSADGTVMEIHAGNRL